MNTFKKTIVAAALATAGVSAQAEVSGSVAIASSYLWRGSDLSAGSAVVSGSLDYAHESGIYAGIWGSSGDDSYGTEYDLYAGWGGNLTEEFSLDIGYVDYNYPNCGPGGTTFEANDGACDFEEVILGLAYGPVGFTFVEPTSTGKEYNYYALSYDISDFNFTVGHWDDDGSDDDGSSDGTHIDVTYAMGDLAFTFSKALDAGGAGDYFANDEAQFVVSYSIPIE